MRSFTFALVAAALATFGSAAPVVPAPPPVPVQGPNISPFLVGPPPGPVVPFPRQAGPIPPLVGPGPGPGPAALGPGQVAPILPSDAQALDGTPSVADIYADLKANISVSINQLNALDTNATTVAGVTATVDGINTVVLAAVPELQALVGFGPVVGSAGLTAAEVAAIVEAEIEALLEAVGHVLAVVDTSIQTDVVTAFHSLDAPLGSLLDTTFQLVPGIEVIVASALVSVASVISEVDMVTVANSLSTGL